MNHKNLFVVLFVVLAAMLTITIVEAQGPKPTPPKSKAPSASVGTAFTYQGQLKKNGVPVNGSCASYFNLFADAGGTNWLAATYGIPNPVTVTNGLFTVQIDFGSGAFQGDARWLQTVVKCLGDSDWTALSLQPLTPVPYSLYSMKTAWGQSMGGTGNGLYARSTDGNGLMGIGDAGMIINPIPLGLTAGVYGESPQAGVWGQTYASGGIGVEGANDSSGNYGQLGTSSYGVYGSSPAGIGIEGVHTNTGNFADLGTYSSGVRGYGVSTGSNGVTGVSSNGGDGVSGLAMASNKSGVYGLNTNGGYGVFGSCAGSGCYGVYSNGDMRVTGNLQVDGQATGFFPHPAFDSGWQAVTPGQCISVAHNLGGDMNNYFVSLTFHTTDVGMSNSGDGGLYMPSGLRGVWYNNLTNTSVQVCTGANALTTDAVRFRIWVYQ
jgi:hypothetical protein